MSFIQDYKTYTEPLEVPELFHVWCALVALSSAAQRKVWLDYDGLFQVSPNLYVCLVAPPGKCGKDTAMNKVREILDNIPGIRTKSDSITKEKIFAYMQEITTQFPLEGHKLRAVVHSSLTIFASEMSLLIKKGDKDFVSALNALYNTIPVLRHSTKHNSESIIVKPFLTILAGTTPDWLNANIQEDLLEGGLSARMIPVYSNTPKPPNYRPTVTEEGRAALGRILKRLEEIVQIGGEFSLAPRTWDLYKVWYEEHHRKEPSNKHLAGYHWRKRTHLLKLSMLYSLAESNKLVVEPDHLDLALATLAITEPVIEQAYARVGQNPLSPIAQDILDSIRSKGRISVAELVRQNYHRLDERGLKEVVSVLCQMGFVKVEPTPEGVFIVSKPK
ncbi:MAG: hypothetical protein QXZ51_01370 [Candidatus Bathyarchaeia archaeon]